MARYILWVATLTIAIAIAVATGEGYQRLGTDYIPFEGVNPGPDSTRVVEGGWPLPYLADSPYISPVGSVHFIAGLVGDDHFKVGPFLLDIAFYFAILIAIAETIRWFIRRRRPAAR